VVHIADPPAEAESAPQKYQKSLRPYLSFVLTLLFAGGERPLPA